jgi:cell wall-associated NlpC family hydrolase
MGIGIEGAPAEVGTAIVTQHPPGDTATDLRAGDFLLTGVTAQGIVSRAIKFGAWLRRYPAPFRRFSHTALVVSENEIVEALGRGVERNPVSKYAPADYAIVRTQVGEHDQRQILDFADAVLAARTRYGYTTIAGLAIYCLTGGQLCIQKAGTAICSGFVSDALTRAGFIWPRPPFAMMPADLAQYFDVRSDPGQP